MIVIVAWMGMSGTSLRADEKFGFAFEQNRTNAVYGVGEEIVFRVTVTNSTGIVRSGRLTAVVDEWNEKPLLKREFDLEKGNPVEIRCRGERPGFLRLRLDGGMGGWDSGRCWAGAAVEPQRIRQTGPDPKDFDAFWTEAVARLDREVPLDPKLELDPARSTAKVDFYRASFATFGRRVRGFLTVPKDRAKGPFRAEVEIASAGEGLWSVNWSGGIDDSMVKLYGLVHDVEMKSAEKFSGDNVAGYLDPEAAKGFCKKYHAELKAALKAKYGEAAYCRAGLDLSREDYYFYPVILGWNRAVDWLGRQPYVDGKRIGYRGGSQGGMFGLYLAGLNHRFAYASLFVPGGGDLLGFTTGRVSTFPGFGERAGRLPDDGLARLKANLPYFDGANFAARIRCPLRVSVGFIDWICDPVSIYAAYNRVRVPDKGIVHGVRRGHGLWPEMHQLRFWRAE